MKAYLMHHDRDFDPRRPLPLNGRDLLDDLELHGMLETMAADDELVLDVCRAALLGATRSDAETIRHRQQVLADALAHPQFIRDLYTLATSAQEVRKKGYWGLSLHHASGVLHGAVDFVGNIIPLLRQVRMLAAEGGVNFQSEGLRRLFSMLEAELSDDYIALVQQHLKTLKFSHGFVMSARIGQGNKGRDYVIRTPNPDTRGWIRRLFDRRLPPQHYTLSPRDEAGARALSELGDRGIDPVANAVAQSAEHIMSFFMMLRTELAFYIGCINLHERLMAEGQPVCMPRPLPQDERRLAFNGLADLALVLKLGRKVVANDLAADGRDLVIITGANQGGKSSFLRGIGAAQLMMQSGMFVTAAAFSANLCNGIYTHYKREEDAGMESGKFDEELKRMSQIVDLIAGDALVLFNESFAATNEREGAEIARQIVDALLSRRIKVLFVSHQFEFSHGFLRRGLPNALFLRAQRQDDGARTFKIAEGEPLQTSYGLDLYRNIFGADAAPADGETPAPVPEAEGEAERRETVP
ncbi:DNA mismatch repair protein MutS [Bordetella genomosp. 10]|uniref:DNA mismatch repair protein MutS n=1 Tax=Bordetella genomosp. 10 TaxID=1416804 RepID=A0A261RZL8_9BORD|nr:DNA mismatch repair protein MutS [Bordetella genomosp. 10]OZI30548.1 DNA mismatch repair protein MutS [Bordetella genomosp. 10]